MADKMRFLSLLLFVPSFAFAANNVLTWDDASTNEANFHVERKLSSCGNADPFTEIATVGANVITFTDQNVTEGVTYCYRVRASNPGGVSPYSNEAGKTVPFVIPAAPTNLRVQ